MLYLQKKLGLPFTLTHGLLRVASDVRNRIKKAPLQETNIFIAFL